MVEKIAVIPAGSSSGTACIQELVAHQVYPRCCHRSLKEFPSNCEVYSDSNAMDRKSLKKAFKDIKSALIVTPLDHSKGFGNDSLMTCNMIEEAVAAGVKYIVLVGSWTVNEPEKCNAIASRFLESEALLKKLEKEHGLQWTVLRGGYFIQNFLMNAMAVKSGGPIYEVNTTYPPIDSRDIGRCAATCLLQGPEKHHGKYYEMNGPKRISVSDFFELLGKALGKSLDFRPIPAIEAPVPDFLKELFTFMEENPEGVPFTQDVGNLIGDKWTDVPTWIEDNKHMFQSSNSNELKGTRVRVRVKIRSQNSSNISIKET
ncbi:hypothetical protein HDV02_004952 [Globomyces sp. JEL0801]|nr:hypothetical protein HDV02_004952 [Globomyces sp. JEL0801]